jgi:hypothetical protein
VIVPPQRLELFEIDHPLLAVLAVMVAGGVVVFVALHVRHLRRRARRRG